MSNDSMKQKRTAYNKRTGICKHVEKSQNGPLRYSRRFLSQSPGQKKQESLGCRKWMRMNLRARRTIKPVIFTITNPLSLLDLCIVGLRCYKTRPVDEKLGNKHNSQTRLASKSGLSLRTVTNDHYHRFLTLFFVILRGIINPIFLF